MNGDHIDEKDEDDVDDEDGDDDECGCHKIFHLTCPVQLEFSMKTIQDLLEQLK